MSDIDLNAGWEAWEAAVQEWARHVADAVDAVIAALGLEPYDPGCDYHRYVTDWIAPNE